MLQIRSILLPNDFSPDTHMAAKTAAQLARHTNAKLTLLHVLEPMPQWPVALFELQRTADELLADLGKALKSEGVERIETITRVGRPPETILDVARASEVDLIVCGAGRLSPFDRYSVGPTALAVIEDSTIPVIAVPPKGAPPQFKRILCPVDQSSASAEGLAYAAALASKYGGELIVMTVVPKVSLIVAAADARQFEDARLIHDSHWRDDFKAFLDAHPISGVQVTTHVGAGRPHEQIIAAAKERHCDAIVMGATGRSGLARVLIGSTTRRILDDLPCSLVVVKRRKVS
jgi:nucleotide-binding universal stress UspA family protein